MQWWRTTTALHVCSAAFVLGVWSCSLGLIFHEAICLLLRSMCRSSANLKCKNLTSSKFYKRYHHITYKCSRSLCFICCFLKRRYHISNCSLLFRLCNDMILSWYKKFETNTATRFTSFCVVSTMTSKDIVIFIKLCQARKFVWIMLCCWCDVLLLLLSSLSNLNESHFTFTVHTRTTWWSAVDLERLRLKNNLPSYFGTILFDLQICYSCQWKLSSQITVSVSGWFLGLLVLYILIILLCRTDGGIAVEDTHQFVDSDDVFERPPFSVLFHIPGAGTTHGLIWAHIYERQLWPDVRYIVYLQPQNVCFSSTLNTAVSNTLTMFCPRFRTAGAGRRSLEARQRHRRDERACCRARAHRAALGDRQHHHTGRLQCRLRLPLAATDRRAAAAQRPQVPVVDLWRHWHDSHKQRLCLWQVRDH